ncbi:HetZ-related protein 2 [Brasilonema bromeliae]|uniref:HetZ-related protein 2 n=1 Tax=Brasilonema bromeliae TaxID=383615 RepID=UPI00145C9FC3
MDRFTRGDLEGAVAQLSNLTQQGQQVEIAGIWLNIPKLPLLEAQRIALYWRKRLAIECSEQSVENRESIISWLLGSDLHRFEVLSQNELDIAKQAMEYRYSLLRQRYLGFSRERAYRNLITMLGSLVTLRHKIQTWIALSRDRDRTVLDVLQEVIQELLQSDNYIQQQMIYISELTTDSRLKNALLFASVEEYCLRPVRNQPLLAYRFVNYLRRTQRGGLTQVPTQDLVRLVSEEILTDDNENRVNLVDTQAVAEYQEAQAAEEQQAVRQTVKQEFEDYLLENLGQEAVEWLRLYIKGKSQDEIAKKLNKPIKEVYQLREKISYHAVRVFALKGKPELVDSWLSISLKEHNLGLTPKQWQQLHEQLTPLQRSVLELRKAGYSIEDTASELKLKMHQAMGELTKVYLLAQALRSQE